MTILCLNGNLMQEFLPKTLHRVLNIKEKKDGYYYYHARVVHVELFRQNLEPTLR